MKKIILFCLILMFAGCGDDAPGGENNNGTDTANPDTGSGTSSDSNNPDTNAETSPGTDTNSGTGDTADTTDELLWIIPDGSTFEDVYGSETVEVTDAGFDISSIDINLDGLNADLPEPTVDCLDPSITKNCISLTGIDRAGQHFEILCIGSGVSVGNSSVQYPDSEEWMVRRGASCSRSSSAQAEVAVVFGAYVFEWDEVPALFDETVMPGDNPPIVYMSYHFRGTASNSSRTTALSSPGGAFEAAKMAGWVRNTTGGVLQEAAFAASWNDQSENAVRFKGTLKAYR
jgi:hypothetical protein